MLCVLVLVAATVMAPSVIATAQSANAPGVTDKTVKLGYIYSGTGPASPAFLDAAKACQARVGRQNAEGGVNGRKIEVEVIDDQSSSANLTAAHDLVQNRNVFAVVNNSAFAFLSYRYLLGEGVPVIGGGFDGSYYGEKGNESIFSALGNSAPFDGLTYDTPARVMKQLGGTKAAVVSYAALPSSVAAAKAFMNYAVPAVGLSPVYTNTTVDLGATDVAPVVLGIKSAGADSVYLPMGFETNFAIVQGLQQNGVTVKANVSATGYGQDLLDSPAANQLGPSTVFTQGWKPVESKDKATKQLQADLKKYSGVTAIPDFGTYLGYITCDMAITGLEHAGKSPTRQSFVDGLRKLGSYDAAGLPCQPLDISLANYGKFPEKGCSYFLYIKDGKWVVMNRGKPYTGKLVGSKELLEANRTGVAPPTTTAAPSS
jgi:branched-chain amino acid transport system substrate-binding protein